MGTILNPRKLYEISDRQQQVFELWKEGATLRAISAALKKKAKEAGQSTRGFSVEQVRQDKNYVIQAMGQDFDADVSEWKSIQLARLNDQYMTFNAVAKGKIDPTTGKREAPDPYAGRLVLGVIKEISEITGVRASVKHEIAPIQMMHTMSSIDLSKLSVEELKQYEDLLKKANAS